MSLHLGLHWNRFLAMGRKLTGKTEPSAKRTLLLRLLDMAIILYGVYAFFKRQFPDYLFMRTHFVFFDFEEPLALFFADYVAVMGLFASVGHYIVRFLIRRESIRR